MKALPTLIKLSQQRVDQQRLRMAKFHDIHNDLSHQLQTLQNILVDEAHKAREDPLLAIHYGRYAHGIEERIKKLQTQIESNLKRLKQEQDHLATLFKDQKGLEVYKTNHDARRQQEKDKREQDAIDEIVSRHRGNNNQGTLS